MLPPYERVERFIRAQLLRLGNMWPLWWLVLRWDQVLPRLWVDFRSPSLLEEVSHGAMGPRHVVEGAWLHHLDDWTLARH